jgi:hypothetical protein
MKRPALILSIILSILSGYLFSQNAPVTTATSVINPQIGSVITVPVKIFNFSDISSISLRLDYDPTVLSLIGCVPNPALIDFFVDGSTTPGRIMSSWYSLSGLSLGDQTPIFVLSFKYNGGTTGLNWFTNDGNCEYTRFDGGLYTVLNDLPKSEFYLNGMVSGKTAPVTIAPMITFANLGNLEIPILVNRFNDIGAISLTLEYDPATMIYQDIFTGNTSLNLSGNWLVGSQDAPNGKKYLRISWLKNETPPPQPVNLQDNSTLITLLFNYQDTLKSSELTWIDDGSSCEYSDGNYNILLDIPPHEFLINGSVSGILTGPVVVAPSFGAPPNTDITIPVIVSGFYNISAFTLRMDYTPGVLTFLGAQIPNLLPSWSLTASTPVDGQLILAGNNSGTSLSDSTVLLNLTFHFQEGTSFLNWYDADNTSCTFTNATSGSNLFDKPQPAHYINGNIITYHCP